jgi:hypothetical protein
MPPEEFVYDREYWSQPRKRGSKVRAQDVLELNVVNAPSRNRKTGGIWCESNE